MEFSKFSKLYNKIFDYSIIKINPLNFQNLIELSKIKTPHKNLIGLTTEHLYKEIPIRFSQRIRDLNKLPFGLNHNHNVSIVRNWYLASFQELIELPKPKNYDDCLKFKNCIEKIYQRHTPTLITLSKGLFELKKSGHIESHNDEKIQLFLNNFYSPRTELRILIEYYLNLFESPHNIINFKSNINQTLNNVVQDINLICDRQNIFIDLNSIVKINSTKTICIPFIDNYLHWIFTELIKNSTQAILNSSNSNPCISIGLQDLGDYVYIKIQDNGIGIKPIDMDKIWLYSYSTNLINFDSIANMTEVEQINWNPLSGFGYGLPITKIYLNFFSSIIQINSKYNEGTNVHLFLFKNSNGN